MLALKASQNTEGDHFHNRFYNRTTNYVSVHQFRNCGTNNMKPYVINFLNALASPPYMLKSYCTRCKFSCAIV